MGSIEVMHALFTRGVASGGRHGSHWAGSLWAGLRRAGSRWA